MMRGSLSSYISHASALPAWLREHSECDHPLTDVESAHHSQRAVRSSPHTGSELSGGEIGHRMLTVRSRETEHDESERDEFIFS
jgi:hypothetical protein